MAQSIAGNNFQHNKEKQQAMQLFADMARKYVEVYMLLTSAYMKHQTQDMIASYLEFAQSFQKTLSDTVKSHQEAQYQLVSKLLNRTLAHLCPELVHVINFDSLLNGVALLVQAILCNSHALNDVKNFVLTNYATWSAPVNSQLVLVASEIRSVCLSNSTASVSMDKVLALTHSQQLLNRCRQHLLASTVDQSDNTESIVRRYLLWLLEQCPSGMATLLICTVQKPDLVDITGHNDPSTNEAIIDCIHRFVHQELLCEKPTIADLNLSLLCLEPSCLHSLLSDSCTMSASAAAAVEFAIVKVSETALRVSDNRLNLNLPDSMAWLRDELTIATVAKQLRGLLASPLPHCVRIVQRLEARSETSGGGLALLLQSLFEHFSV